jgi:hypothetical protein
MIGNREDDKIRYTGIIKPVTSNKYQLNKTHKYLIAFRHGPWKSHKETESESNYAIKKLRICKPNIPIRLPINNTGIIHVNWIIVKNQLIEQKPLKM